MSIQTEITRLQELRSALRAKLVALGIAQSTANLEDCIAAVEAVDDRGAVAGAISTKAEEYSVQAGYHNGGGKVGIAAAEQEKITAGNIKFGVSILGVTGNYSGAGANLQAKTVTPTKATQDVTADDGYDALSQVTVNAIPEIYQDVSGVTAEAADVLAKKVIVLPSGVQTAGTMPNNGAVTAAIDGLNVISYMVPAGYHSGGGTVGLTGDIEAALAAI